MNNYAVKPELIKNFIDVVIPSNPSFIKDFEVVKREGSLVPNSFAIVYELTDEYNMYPLFGLYSSRYPFRCLI